MRFWIIFLCINMFQSEKARVQEIVFISVSKIDSAVADYIKRFAFQFWFCNEPINFGGNLLIFETITSESHFG